MAVAQRDGGCPLSTTHEHSAINPNWICLYRRLAGDQLDSSCGCHTQNVDIEGLVFTGIKAWREWSVCEQVTIKLAHVPLECEWSCTCPRFEFLPAAQNESSMQSEYNASSSKMGWCRENTNEVREVWIRHLCQLSLLSVVCAPFLISLIVNVRYTMHNQGSQVVKLASATIKQNEQLRNTYPRVETLVDILVSSLLPLRARLDSERLQSSAQTGSGALLWSVLLCAGAAFYVPTMLGALSLLLLGTLPTFVGFVFFDEVRDRALASLMNAKCILLFSFACLSSIKGDIGLGDHCMHEWGVRACGFPLPGCRVTRVISITTCMNGSRERLQLWTALHQFLLHILFKQIMTPLGGDWTLTMCTIVTMVGWPFIFATFVFMAPHARTLAFARFCFVTLNFGFILAFTVLQLARAIEIPKAQSTIHSTLQHFRDEIAVHEFKDKELNDNQKYIDAVLQLLQANRYQAASILRVWCIHFGWMIHEHSVCVHDYDVICNDLYDHDVVCMHGNAGFPS